MAVAAPSVEGPEFAEKVRRADEITRRLQESNWDFDAVPELFTRAATCDVVAKEIVTLHDGRAQTLLGRLVMNGIGERSEEHTSELQSRPHLVCRLLLEKKNKNKH